MDQLKLRSNISSPQDVKAIIAEVRRYARWFAGASIKAKVTTGAQAEPITISAPAAELIEQASEGKPITHDILDSLLLQLENMLTNTPSIVITLAAMPGSKLKNSILQWCRGNISPELLVDFRFNATILGGMVVQYNSHVYDWSWRKQIMADRAKFAGVLRNV